MQPFNIRELTRTDTEALLAFEVRNRDWFESHIDARDPAFYSLRGVAKHIESYLSDFEMGAWHPLVIEENVSSRKVLERCGFLPHAHSPGGEDVEAECRFILSI